MSSEVPQGTTPSSSELIKFTFFSLPAEIRVLIYKELFRTRNKESRKILFICRQTYHEAFPILMQQPWTFSTLNDLVKWTFRVSPHLLKHVREASDRVCRV